MKECSALNSVNLLQFIENKGFVMSNYDEQFKLFNLPKEKFLDYKNADQFARAFERCSVQTRENVTYSIDTSLLNRKESLNTVNSKY